MGSELRWRWFEFSLDVTAFLELGWQLYDASVLDTSGFNLSVLRIMGLGRVARILRVCRLHLFADLVTMINGAIGCTWTLLWSLALVAIPIYAVAMLMRESLGASASAGLGAEAWGSCMCAHVRV